MPSLKRKPCSRWPASPTRIRRAMVSCWAGSCPMTSTRAVPSRRPRWNIGPPFEAEAVRPGRRRRRGSWRRASGRAPRRSRDRRRWASPQSYTAARTRVNADPPRRRGAAAGPRRTTQRWSGRACSRRGSCCDLGLRGEALGLYVRRCLEGHVLAALVPGRQHRRSITYDSTSGRCRASCPVGGVVVAAHRQQAASGRGRARGACLRDTASPGHTWCRRRESSASESGTWNGPLNTSRPWTGTGRS